MTESSCRVSAGRRTPSADAFLPMAPAAAASSGERRLALPGAAGYIVPWAFYAFVFSIFFEYPQRKFLPVEVPTITASLFLLVALLHAGVCFAWPPPAAWKWIAIYLGLYRNIRLGALVHFQRH